jgi:hypothetical protein
MCVAVVSGGHGEFEPTLAHHLVVLSVSTPKKFTCTVGPASHVFLRYRLDQPIIPPLISFCISVPPLLSTVNHTTTGFPIGVQTFKSSPSCWVGGNPGDPNMKSPLQDMLRLSGAYWPSLEIGT